MEEQKIKNSILHYISLYPQVGFAWSQYNGAVYDQRRGFFRKPSKYYIKGIPDICGIWRQRPLFIEVKKPGGKVSQEQKNFLERAREHHAIAAVCYGLGDAMELLRLE